MNTDTLDARHEATYSGHTKSFMEGYQYGRVQAGGPYLASIMMCFGMALVALMSINGLDWWDVAVLTFAALTSMPLSRSIARTVSRIIYPRADEL